MAKKNPGNPDVAGEELPSADKALRAVGAPPTSPPLPPMPPMPPLPGFAPPPPPAARQVKPVEDEMSADVALRFAFVGVGQGGGRMACAFHSLGYRRIAVVNTTSADFFGLPDSVLKLDLQLGGAGKQTEVGAKAIADNAERIDSAIGEAWGPTVDVAFVCASLGGGTGSGGIHRVIQIAKDRMTRQGIVARVGAIVSLPSPSEGAVVAANALHAMRQLWSAGVSPLIVVDNAAVNAAYRPSISGLYPMANNYVAGLLHAFNAYAAVHSSYMSFDRAEFTQILDAGAVVFGVDSILRGGQGGRLEDLSASLVSESVRQQLGGEILAKVDMAQAKVAACLFVANQVVLESISTDFLDAGFTAIGRSVGTGLVHRGIYEVNSGTTPTLASYVAIAGMPISAKTLQPLIDVASSVAPFSPDAFAASLFGDDLRKSSRPAGSRSHAVDVLGVG